MSGRHAKRVFGFFVVLVLATGCASRPTADRPALASLPGTGWRLISISDGGRTIVLPTARPRVKFGRNGSIVLGDTLNALSGHYTVDSTGLTISHAGSTLVGYAGTDPNRTATIAAINSIVYRFSNGTSLPSNHVSATRAGDTLRIRSQHYELKYRFAGAYSEPAIPSSTGSNR